MVRNTLSSPGHAGFSRLKGPVAYPLHDHDFGEVFWVESGVFTHLVNEVEVTLRPGDTVMIRPWDRHAFLTPGDEVVEIVNICFQWSICQGLVERHFPRVDLYGEALSLPRMVSLQEGQIAYLRESVLSLVKQRDSSFLVERFLFNYLGEVLLPVELMAVEVSPPGWMQQAMMAIRRPDGLRLGVPEFYRLCGRSPEHVSREFHRVTGVTIVQWLHRLRMEHAAALLAATQEEIVEICFDCGYESLSHFYACFRKRYGTTPSLYRRRAQQQLYPAPMPLI